MRISILILTDHLRHSDQNSVYDLAKGFLNHGQVSRVDVATRSHVYNNTFFYDQKFEKLSVITIDEHFDFVSAKEQFRDEFKESNTSQYDIIFMRLPRPVSDEFLLGLEATFPHTYFINSPIGIVETSNKAFLTQFAGHSVPLKVCYSIQDVKEFHKQFSIVLKPLREYGGKGVVKVIDGQVIGSDFEMPLDDFLITKRAEIQSNGILAMKYLKNVSQGDKRILVVNGIVLAASLRLPASGGWLCNVAQGGTSMPAQIDQVEQAIVDSISPILLKKGIIYYGLDTLVDDSGKRILSEINVLSVGGFPQAQIQTGRPIINEFVNEYIKLFTENRKIL